VWNPSSTRRIASDDSSEPASNFLKSTLELWVYVTAAQASRYPDAIADSDAPAIAVGEGLTKSLHNRRLTLELSGRC